MMTQYSARKSNVSSRPYTCLVLVPIFEEKSAPVSVNTVLKVQKRPLRLLMIQKCLRNLQIEILHSATACPR